MSQKHPLILMILDGWGYRQEVTHNAIALAKTPQWDEWWSTRPHMLLEASGLPVGLPPAQMGNSEVGHMHIGAGRIIPQDFTRINQAISNGDFENNPLLIDMLKRLRQQNKALHVMGLFSEGGVHSHRDHLFACLRFCFKHQFTNVYLHLFADGRDTPPQSILDSLSKLEALLSEFPVATISTLCGRYYAMDRDHRWHRIEPVYRLLAEGSCAHQFNSVREAIDCYYQQGLTDEFMPPTQINHCPPIQTGDAIFFFNFRSDRARQLTEVFLSPSFNAFPRPIMPKLNQFVSMTAYASYLPTTHVFPPYRPVNTLGEVLAQHHLKQLRIAETEKYAHVTFFLNGGTEEIYPYEDRKMIPSPKVATYDLKPQMSAPEMTDVLAHAIQSNLYDVIICNYANADMVGHTGNLAATVQAIECLDQCMKIVWKTLNAHDGQLIITADHGNAEEMYDCRSAQPHTAHTDLPVPFVYIGQEWICRSHIGSLTDIAPTILTLLNIPIPKEMTGRPLLVKKSC